MTNTIAVNSPIMTAVYKIRNGAKKVSDKVTAAALSGVLMMEMAPVYATRTASEDIPSITINTDAGTTEIFSRLLGMVIWIARFIGAFLLLWGIVMFALALKNDEPESKTKAIMAFASGAVLLGLQAILTAAGIIS